ncbi:hypothetical protein AALP_AA4G240800 [Arabis alpina]|uniref:Uncharacterized protein n=1 Tax=Arabis alpina TaxID=50452 RepID=A0A087H5B0_ARAAL|nr:hypothetical protein AALP_AA4G240800 [Arabis alpina]
MYDISQDVRTLSDERLYKYDTSNNGHGLPGRWNLRKAFLH